MAIAKVIQGKYKGKEYFLTKEGNFSGEVTM